MLDEDGEFYLLLGDCDREGIVSKLKASAKFYRKKLLESGEENWRQVRKLLFDHRIRGVMVKLTGTAALIAISAPRKQLASDIFERISKLPHIVFLHESILLSKEDRKGTPYERNTWGYFSPIDQDQIDKLKELITSNNINLYTYSKNSEITNAGIEFIDEIVNRLLFRIYVPNGRMWAAEAGKLLDLFRHYLTTVSGLSVREERVSTANGVIHELYSNEEIAAESLQNQFADFSTLMDLSVSDRDAAIQFVSNRAPSARVLEIVDKYAKEAKRLSIDMRHEREKTVLSIKHRLEQELSDEVENLDWTEVDQIIASHLPDIAAISAITFGGARGGPQTVHVHQGPSIFGSVSGVVASEINGNQHLGADAAEVMRIVQTYGAGQVGDLANAVLEIEDEGVRPSERQSALSKLKRFAMYSSGKLGDVAFGVLQTYIESRAGL